MKRISIYLASVLLATLGACTSDSTSEEVRNAREKVEQASDEVKHDLTKAGKEMGDAVEHAARDVEEVVDRHPGDSLQKDFTGVQQADTVKDQ